MAFFEYSPFLILKYKAQEGNPKIDQYAFQEKLSFEICKIESNHSKSWMLLDWNGPLQKKRSLEMS